MPTYVYKVILENDVEGPEFEYQQSIEDPPLTTHPITGHKVKRIIQAPHIGKAQPKLNDNAYLKSKGFTKYEKDKLTGKYHEI